MCKLFDLNRENLIKLIYELESFTEEEIREKLGDYEGLIGDSLTVEDFLFSLCETGLLSYDGFTFRLVPEEHQINHQLFKRFSYV